MRVALDVQKDSAEYSPMHITACFGPGVTAVIGPNGAGKTTLLRMMAGLILPDRGSYAVDGRQLYRYLPGSNAVVGIDPVSRMALAKQLGYVPQSAIMHVSMNVKDALEYLACMRGKASRRRVGHIMKQWHLEEVAYMRLANLSPGQRRRFLVAQSLLTDPSLWLLDEPTAGLAPEERQAVLGAIASRPKCTTVIATHILEDAAAIADRVLIMRSGHIIWNGRLQDMYDAAGCPSSAATALEQAYINIMHRNNR
ncbi:MAG: type transport system ATP-binding protein [Clostridiales bacterium]|jgi:ABC-2 type transport system ATP-binding protein|nr:type transport system ATP-binding protein [Clostridiales bacterium]MDK2992334.1 type transport system ATP-binding protein [Clostridiales bacterium]